jgi:hypothetical protein
MMHKTRQFTVVAAEDAVDLAHKLTQYTWCVCNGFRLGDYLFLNDSTGGDGAQEYGIVKEGRQIESITFGWCNEARGLELIQEILAGKYDGDAYTNVTNEIQTPAEHGRCRFCA